MWKYPALVILLVSLAGCQTMEEVDTAEDNGQAEEVAAEPQQQQAAPLLTPPRSIGLFAADDANESLVTAVDIVFLYDAALVKSMPANAPAWFDLKTRIRQRHAGTLDVVSLEVPPGKAVAVKMPKRASKAVEVFAYASFLSKDGIKRLRLTPFKDVAIYLNEKMIEAGNQ